MTEPKVTPKLKPEVKKLWTDALVSGEFEQGQGRLCNEVEGVRSFCCYGVLCELYRRATGDGEWKVDHSKVVTFRSNPEAEYGMIGLPPEVVIGWAFDAPNISMVVHNAVVEIDGIVARLHNHNDANNKKSFAELSAAIKEQL